MGRPGRRHASVDGPADGGAHPRRRPRGPGGSGPLQLRGLARQVPGGGPPLPAGAAAGGRERVTAIGLIAGALGALVLIAGRLHFMLHLFQLEHYEPARLRVWVERRGARMDRELLVGCLVAGLALTAAAAAGVLMLEVGVISGGWLAWRGLRLLRRPQTKPLVFTARARRLFVAALAIPTAVLLLAAVAVLVGAPAWVAAVIGTATAVLGV